VKQLTSDKIMMVIVHILLVFVLIITLFPLIFVLSASISDPNAVYRGEVWLLPKGISFEGYARVFRHSDIIRGYINSILYMAGYVSVSLFCTMPCAYALSHKDFRAKNWVMAYFTITMFFGGGIVPSYLLMKSLHLLDTYWALVIPGSVSAYNIIISRTFFHSTIPGELWEAAQLDGCNHTRFFLKIVLPLSKPITFVILLYAAVNIWNSYFNALMYLSTETKYPLQIILRQILLQTQIDSAMLDQSEDVAAMKRISEIIKYALIVVSSLPMMLLYPFVQKHFVKGMMIGSIKG